MALGTANKLLALKFLFPTPEMSSFKDSFVINNTQKNDKQLKLDMKIWMAVNENLESSGPLEKYTPANAKNTIDSMMAWKERKSFY